MVGQYHICVDIWRSFKGTGDREGCPVGRVVTTITHASTLYNICSSTKEGDSTDGIYNGTEDTNNNNTKDVNKKRLIDILFESNKM